EGDLDDRAEQAPGFRRVLPLQAFCKAGADGVVGVDDLDERTAEPVAECARDRGTRAGPEPNLVKGLSDSRLFFRDPGVGKIDQAGLGGRLSVFNDERLEPGLLEGRRLLQLLFFAGEAAVIGLPGLEGGLVERVSHVFGRLFAPASLNAPWRRRQ